MGCNDEGNLSKLGSEKTTLWMSEGALKHKGVGYGRLFDIAIPIRCVVLSTSYPYSYHL
jgi:hypothetical protein